MKHMSKRIVEIVHEHILPIVEPLHVELVDVEFVKEGPNYFLRVYVDQENGIDLDTCGIVSEKISEMLDVVDPIAQEYILEVSSPGAERPLKKKEDYIKSIGKNIFVTLYEPLNGVKSYEGILLSFEENKITLLVTEKTRKTETTIPYDKIAACRLAILFA